MYHLFFWLNFFPCLSSFFGCRDFKVFCDIFFPIKRLFWISHHDFPHPWVLLTLAPSKYIIKLHTRIKLWALIVYPPQNDIFPMTSLDFSCSFCCVWCRSQQRSEWREAVFGGWNSVWEFGKPVSILSIIRGPLCDSGPKLYVSEHPFPHDWNQGVSVNMTISLQSLILHSLKKKKYGTYDITYM